MKRLVPALAALFALCACDDTNMTAAPVAPLVRLPAVAGRPASGYFSLTIDGDRGALMSVTSRQARRTEMHETMNGANMTSMRALDRISVNNGDEVTFTPGGRHLMLYDLDPGIRPGSHIILVFNFERGPPRSLDARVVAAGAPE
jgi:periplasmic copper chaperone A